MPYVYPDDPLMAGAWASALKWAYSEPDIVAAFERDTGLTPMPARTSGLEAMIDKACGVHAERAEAFVKWFNVNVWGDDPFEPSLSSGRFNAE